MFKSLFPLLLGATLWADAHIFVYHRFGDAEHLSTNTSLSAVEQQFNYFKAHHYKVIPLSRLSQALHHQEPIPDNWVVLTIDDSYKTFYTNALPLFKKFNYPFTLFVYVEATQKGYGDFMSWEEVRDASHYGEIALHSYSHPHLSTLTKEAIRSDSAKGIEYFEKAMGYRPKYYAYPYGEYTPAVRDIVKSFHFDLICNQNAGAVDTNSDPDDLDRIALTGDVNLKPKLALKTLQTVWIEPKSYPKRGILKRIHAKISPSVTHVEYYVSGYGWKWADVVEGDVNITFNKPLKFSRNRIFLKNGSAQSGTIIVKE